MIRDNQKYFNRLHVIIDLLVVESSYLASWYLKFKTPIFEHESGRLSFDTYMRVSWFIVPLYMLLYLAFHLYTSKRVQGRRMEFGNILKANVLGLMIVLTVLYIMRQHYFSREMLFIFFVINMLMEVLVRSFIRFLLHMMRKSGFNKKHILLVGYSRAAESYIDRIKAFPQWGYEVKGILDDNVEIGTNYNGVKVIGKTDTLLELLAENDLDEIAITLGLNEYSKLAKLVNLCEKSGVHTQFVPDYNNIIPSRPYTEDLMGLPVINIRYVPLSNTFNALLKRVFDIVCSGIGIIVLSPLLLIIACAVKFTSKGPLIFKQERVGLRNEPFMMYKFRSMRVQDEKEEKKAWTVKDDPRVTKVGKFLRRTSLDELPQLFNIFKGEMSIVGPRPERPYFVEKFKEEIPRYMVKHQVRPGLTGWAQVNGYRGDTSIKKRIEYDLYYIENWTFGFDIKIMFMTIFKGFVNKNAY
ncbi:MAG: undecaprenyl-phosphate glucose phosphotransferase [Clostridiales bacterium]|nr:undecaprenyl-phosphate glucose phosphotransferase [Clostridiales bacterium]MDD6292967.1 undecaprenyl-phosphate glucose phosphotransferase [Eubacteriales bacterium]